MTHSTTLTNFLKMVSWLKCNWMVLKLPGYHVQRWLLWIRACITKTIYCLAHMKRCTVPMKRLLSWFWLCAFYVALKLIC